MKYTIYWQTGKVDLVESDSAEDAFEKLGIKEEDYENISFYTEGDTTKLFEFNDGVWENR